MNPPASHPHQQHELEQAASLLLQESTMRSTGARIKVLALLLGARRALSHQDVQQALPAMDRVTLYRTLDHLAEAGLAHKITGDDRVFRYSAGNEQAAQGGSSGHQHGHFKCVRCARVFCLDAPAGHAMLGQQMQALLQDTLGLGFQSQDIELTIKGRCAECAAD
jgi:Fur family ferric uptake transcriptional regulator